MLAGFTIAFGTRHLDTTERHEGMVAAIAFESVVKLLAFVAVGVFVCWGLFDGPGDMFARAAGRTRTRAAARPRRRRGDFAGGQWFALTLLAMLSVILLPRQFQMMVVENVDERHLQRATWAFPLYLLLINLFVLPIALGGLLHFGSAARADAETFVLSLPLALGQSGAGAGGLHRRAVGGHRDDHRRGDRGLDDGLQRPGDAAAAARTPRLARATSAALLLARAPRVVIVALLLLGYLYFRIAGEAYALVSIGLISFAAVAQFAPALLGGMYWKGGTRAGALAGLGAGFALWAWTLLLPSIAKSGWLPAALRSRASASLVMMAVKLPMVRAANATILSFLNTCFLQLFVRRS